jgi:hypothetical protein
MLTHPHTNKITSAIAMVGMQSQISRLTDVFEKSMETPEDGMATRHSLAISHLQQVDDGLTTEKKVWPVQLFQDNPGLAQTYLDLISDDLCQV